MSNEKWLALLCLSRIGFSLIFTAYASVLPVLMPAWGMSAAQAGLIQSSWHAGYLLSLFFAGFLVDRFGGRTAFLGMSYGACASALLFALLASDFYSGLTLYFLAGLCAGGSYTPVLTLIALRFATGQRGKAMGYYLAAASFGYAVSLLGSSLVAPSYGWRAALMLAAAGTLLGMILAWVALRHTTNVVVRAREQQPWITPIVKVWRNRPAQLAIWSYSFHAWELLGMWAWLPAFLVSAAANGGEISAGNLQFGVALAGLTHLISVFGSVAGGVLSDRIGRTRVILLMSCTSLLCSFSFGWLVGAAMWIVALVAIVYNFTAIADSAVFSTLLTEVVPQEHIGIAFSIRSVLGFGMGAISPWMFGLVLDWAAAGDASRYSWGLAWGSLGLGALLGPILTIRLHRHKR
jgi:MFS family permease